MSQDHWEQLYQSGDTHWDKGAPSPGLVDFLATHPDLGGGDAPVATNATATRASQPRPAVCVPGCGTGHDVREFAKAGFATFGFDIAPSAIRLAIEKTGTAGKPGGPASCRQLVTSEKHAGRMPALPGEASFQVADFLRDDPPQMFDWIFEHTLFCAIKPEERNDYVRAVLRWLRPEGQYLAVNYMIVDEGQGPPFSTTREELWQRFSPHFKLAAEWVPRSYHNRVGRERMFWWRRKSG